MCHHRTKVSKIQQRSIGGKKGNFSRNWKLFDETMGEREVYGQRKVNEFLELLQKTEFVFHLWGGRDAKKGLADI